MRNLALAALGILVLTGRAVNAEQREFPTGDQREMVSYSDGAGPGHPTFCTVTINSFQGGAVRLGITFALFSNNTFTIIAGSQLPMPTDVASGSDATLKLDSLNMFSKVTRAFTQGGFHVIALAPEVNTLQTGYDAINQIAARGAAIEVAVSGGAMPSVYVPANLELNEALVACHNYMVAHMRWGQ